MEEHNDLQLFNMILNREDLNLLMSKLAENDLIKTVVSNQGEIEFDIPYESSFHVKPFNFVDRLIDNIVDLEQQKLRYKEGGKKYNEIEDKILNYSITLDVLMELYNEMVEKRNET